jgi:mannose-6-phosphate isomerase
MSEAGILNDLIFFEANRVWRCYTGGKLLDELTRTETPVDGNFPEEWLASVTLANNDAHQQSPAEGLSIIKGTNSIFRDMLRKFPEAALGTDSTGDPGVLCKYLDSAVRLPIQCHPDRRFARKHCRSEYGKTESWLILETRAINGEQPYILLGFKPGVTEARFRAAVADQDIRAMTGCLHKFPVKPGDVFFIPGRIPHAIGPGLLLLEVQEPTDLVVQPEKQIGNVELTDNQMWGALTPGTAMSCFDYRTDSAERVLQKLRLIPETAETFPEAVLENVIDTRQTECFKVEKLTITGRLDYKAKAPWHLAVVVAGQGDAACPKPHAIKAGDCFFVSNQIDRIAYQATGADALQLFLITA